MKVKKIKFPKFEDWWKGTDTMYDTVIGFYSIGIGVTSQEIDGPKILLQAAVADRYHWSATNMYADKVVSFSGWIDRNDKKAIKNWYEYAINLINKQFPEYIRKTYFES